MTIKSEDNTKAVVLMFLVVAVLVFIGMILEFHYIDLGYFIFTVGCLIRFLYIKKHER